MIFVVDSEIPGHAHVVCNAGYMCRMAYMYMGMQSREGKMSMVMPNVHDKVTRIILAGTVSCVNSIQAEQVNQYW